MVEEDERALVGVAGQLLAQEGVLLWVGEVAHPGGVFGVQQHEAVAGDLEGLEQARRRRGRRSHVGEEDRAEAVVVGSAPRVGFALAGAVVVAPRDTVR